MTTNQQFLALLAPLVAAQGEDNRSKAASGTCYYRHPSKPLSCWIGLLIPQDRYTPRMDCDDDGSTSVSCNPHVKAVLKDVYGPDIDIDFLALIQRAHDNGKAFHDIVA